MQTVPVYENGKRNTILSLNALEYQISPEGEVEDSDGQKHSYVISYEKTQTFTLLQPVGLSEFSEVKDNE